MHLGSSPILGNYKKKNLKYILLNNGVHESVGAQFCISQKINFEKLSQGFGYKNYFMIKNKKELKKKLIKFFESKKSSFLEVKIKKLGINSLPRIRNTAKVLKSFMD